MNLHSYFPAIVCFVLVKTVQNVPVRLTGGSGPHEGRLEVYVRNKWGGVFVFGSVSIDENVVPNLICRQLGYQGYAFATDPSVFDDGPYEPIVYEYINCGYYFNVPRTTDDCIIKDTKNKPYEGAPMGIICNVTSRPQVRLVGGSGNHEGRLEVFFQGKWGSVSHGFDKDEYESKFALNNAKVVCNTLGYSEGTSMISSTQFGSGSGHIWLRELECRGSEGYIHECVHLWANEFPEWVNDHSRDVSVICNVTSNDIRLVGGSGPHEGRVEVRYKGQWGTLWPWAAKWRASVWGYDENHNSAPAVICRQLGYESGESFEVSSQIFGEGSGLQWKRVEFCFGVHSFPCIFNAESNEPADHLSDIGVICNITKAPMIRLMDGTSAHEGRVEMLIANQWGTLCDRALTTSYQDEKERDVTQLCHRLGYSGRDMKKPLTTKEFGKGELRNDFTYSGSCLEYSLKMTSCAKAHWARRELCNYSINDTAIGITCDASTPPVPVRLVGGSGPYEGVVQVYQQGEWGSICVNDMREWGQKEATAVCNQLGYMYRPRYEDDEDKPRILGVNQPTSGDIFGANILNSINLDRVNCSAVDSDSILKDCDLGELTGSHLCNHSHDVGVVCGVRYPLPPLIRLVNGTNTYEGRLEIFFQDEWGTVCHDEDWTYEQLPSVVCKQIGVNGEKAELTRQYGPGEGRVWLERVSCEGGEPGIDSCRHAAWGAVTCDHAMDIGIKCNVFISVKIGIIPVVIVAVIFLLLIVFVIAVYIYKRKPAVVFQDVAQVEMKEDSKVNETGSCKPANV